MKNQLTLFDADPGDRLHRDWGTDHDLFGQVLEVRRQIHGRATVYPFDEYSDHYLLTRDWRPIGSLTVTHASDGPVDCQGFYPDALFDRFGDRLISACKSGLVPHEGGFGIWRRFVQSGWHELLHRGVRLDVINVRRDRRRAFEAMGYVPIQGCRFTHPTLGTDSVGMFLAADPSRRSMCRSVFEQFLGERLPVGHVLSVIAGGTPAEASGAAE